MGDWFMRIWDVNPGYLNRQSLLGEHRELHGIVSILVNQRKGYARHPETLRWVGCGWALSMRHRLLSEEMSLRGYHDRSPVDIKDSRGVWPPVYIDSPQRQYELLAEKYREREPGRISLPVTAQQLWRQHKYSVMARNLDLYRQLGGQVAGMRPGDDFTELSRLLCEQLRLAPSPGGIRNVLQHMWGYLDVEPGLGAEHWTIQELLKELQARTLHQGIGYLVGSTALGELAAWVGAGDE